MFCPSIDYDLNREYLMRLRREAELRQLAEIAQTWESAGPRLRRVWIKPGVLTALIVLAILAILFLAPAAVHAGDNSPRLDPGAAPSQYEALWAGLMHMKAGDYEAAIAEFDRVVDENPLHIGAHAVRGEAYFRTGQYGRAIADSLIAIELAPDYAPPHKVLGHVDFALGRYGKAWKHYQDYLARAEDYVDPLVRQNVRACEQHLMNDKS